MSSYSVKSQDGECRFSIEGGLTAVLVPEVQETMKSQIAAGVRNVTLDLETTRMLDSSGIGLLIAASNTLAQKQGKLAVINASPDIFRLLSSMRLVSRLNVSRIQVQE